MTPTELRQLLLYGESTDENFKRLPPEAGGIWCSRPTREQVERGRYFMYLRVALLAAATIYLFYFHRGIGEARVLPWIIACYEFAYYTLRKEKDEQDHLLARERYTSRVDELIHALHPRWKPEKV
ncbi:hypothetical protein [Roseateles sp. P5_E11]